MIEHTDGDLKIQCRLLTYTNKDTCDVKAIPLTEIESFVLTDKDIIVILKNGRSIIQQCDGAIQVRYHTFQDLLNQYNWRMSQ